jgi:uncharacterized protein
MIASYYNYYLDKFREKGYGLVYNSNWGSILKIDNEELWDCLRNNRINELESDVQSLLEKYGLCTESFDTELTGVRTRYEKHIYDNQQLYLTLLPTEACNFACPYCFVYEKKACFMDAEMYHIILDLILKHCQEEGTKTIYINWFGGEPTLCLNDIVDFMNELKSRLDSDIEVFSSVTTNGYLLNVDAFLKLQKCGVEYFQVTIDGTREVHNSSRYLRDGQGTYDIIMKNLEDISALPSEYTFSMDIRSNFRKSTFESVNSFLDIFKSKFGGDSRFHAYCRPVYYFETKDHEIDSMRDDLFNLEEGISHQGMLAEKVVGFFDDKIEHRIFDPLPQPTECWCNAELKNHAIIGPAGEIYICDTLTGEENICGNIRTLKNFSDVCAERYNIFEDERTHKCLNCKRLPICMGSCMRNRRNSEAQCYWSDADIMKALEKYDLKKV